MDNRFDFEFDESAVIREMREFLKDSANAYSSDMQRVRDDLVFASGDQWDKNIISDLRRTKRINKSFNEYDKYVNAIVSNIYSTAFDCDTLTHFDVDTICVR